MGIITLDLGLYGATVVLFHIISVVHLWLNETLRWTRSTLAPFALVRLFSLVPHLLPVVPIIPVVTICTRAFPVACLSRRFDHAILLAFHGNLYHDSAPTALH